MVLTFIYWADWNGAFLKAVPRAEVFYKLNFCAQDVQMKVCSLFPLFIQSVSSEVLLYIILLNVPPSRSHHTLQTAV